MSDAAKKTKQEVDYSPGMPQGDRCGVCEHFTPRAQACELVRGTILAMMWCKLFKRLKGAT